jgi:hypothetical protein
MRSLLRRQFPSSGAICLTESQYSIWERRPWLFAVVSSTSESTVVERPADPLSLTRNGGTKLEIDEIVMQITFLSEAALAKAVVPNIVLNKFG